MLRVNESKHTIELVSFYDLSDVERILWEISAPKDSLTKKEKWEILKSVMEEFTYESFIDEDLLEDKLMTAVTDKLMEKGI